MRIIFIVPPGAGKGTQCKRLANFLCIPHLSTGDMLRITKEQDSRLGRRIASCIDHGQLAPDYLATGMAIQFISSDECKSGCLFDGYPRTLLQSHLLTEHLAQSEKQIDLVLYLDVAEETLVERLLKRAEIESREDDTAETIQKRLKIFHDRTVRLLEYYERSRLLRRIDGCQDPDQVFRDIRRIVSELQGVRCNAES